MDWLGTLAPPFPDPVNRDHPLNRGREIWLMSMPPTDGGRRLFDLMGLHHGVLTNGTAWSRDRRVQQSVPLSFDGADDYVAAAAPDAPFLGGISIFAWVKFRVGSIYHSVACKALANGGANNPFDFRTDNSATPKLELVRADGSSFAWYSSGPAVSVGVWHRVGVTVLDGSLSTSAIFYVDGVPTTITSGATGGVTGTGEDIWIGRRQDGAVQTDGLMDDVSFWSRGLSAAEAKADYDLSRQGYPGVLSRLSRPILIGSSATAYTLTAAAGSFAQTGVAATLRVGRVLPAATGSFAVSGVAAGLARGYRVTAVVGAFSITGVAAGLRAARILTAAKGTFTFTGIAANLAYGTSNRLVASTGSFSLTGQAANFIYVRHIAFPVTAGAYAITGINATLQLATADGWTRLPVTAETWTPAGTTAETWTPVPANSETWSAA